MRTDRSVSNNEKSDDHDEDRQDDGEDDDMNVKNIARYCSEVATLAGVLSYLFLQLGDEIKNQGLSAFMRQLVSRKLAAFLVRCVDVWYFCRQMHRQRRFFSFRTL